MSDDYTRPLKPSPFIESVEDWCRRAGQLPAVRTPTPEWGVFFLAMQLEELAEKVETIYPDAEIVRLMFDAASWLRCENGEAVARAYRERPGAVLGEDLDVIWVSLAAALATGANVTGALGELEMANYRKLRNGRAVLLDRKVVKPQGWRRPDYTKYIHPDLLK